MYACRPGTRDLETASETSNSIGVLRIILESFLLVADRKANFKASAQMVLKFMDWAVRDLRPPEIVRACSYGGTRPSVGAV